MKKRESGFKVPIRFKSIRRSRQDAPQRAASPRSMSDIKDVGSFVELDGKLIFTPSSEALEIIKATANELGLSVQEMINTALAEGLRIILEKN